MWLKKAAERLFFYCRYVRGLQFEDVRFWPKATQSGQALRKCIIDKLDSASDHAAIFWNKFILQTQPGSKAVAKLMDQRTFDCAALMIMTKYASGQSDEDIALVFSILETAFSDVDQCLNQIAEVRDYFSAKWSYRTQDEQFNRARALYNARQGFDQNMITRTLLKKILGCRLLTPSNPNPESRVAKAIENIELLDRTVK